MIPNGPPAVGPVIRPVEVADNVLSQVALDLFMGTTGRPLRTRWEQASPALRAFLTYVYDAVGEPLVIGKDVPPSPLVDPVTDDGTCWVAFSGGKDGLATALIARENGMRPVLYHVQGINRGSPDEAQYAQEASIALGMPLVIDRVSVSGQRAGFIEMPTKNQVITALMVARMLECGGARYTLGTMRADVPSECQIGMNWSDSTNSNSLWATYMAELIPGMYHVPPVLKNELQSLAVVAQHGLLHYAHGCMAPWRYRKSFRNRAVAKFGDAILPGRCGTCYKCQSEYIMLVGLGALPKTGFYTHAIESMMRNAEKTGVREWSENKTIEEEYLDLEILGKYKDTQWPPVGVVTSPPPMPPAPVPRVKTDILSILGA